MVSLWRKFLVFLPQAVAAVLCMLLAYAATSSAAMFIPGMLGSAGMAAFVFISGIWKLVLIADEGTAAWNRMAGPHVCRKCGDLEEEVAALKQALIDLRP